ncbi:PAS domain-containing protein [Antarcticirhabdus aurantiaca]|uniref:PAS domain-containing protein n=1 Tax=Antarcticirhabdus aurantiaca TaxID=2606717 RepID=A0ACD4NJI3_9HYPH|nr:PAS domain-containing protein [Jeongeuplla avenae]
MCALFGVDAAEGAQGMDPDRMLRRIHPDDRAEALVGLQATFAAPGSYTYRYRLLSDGSEFRWLRAHGACFTDEAGRPTHISGVLLTEASANASLEVEIVERLMGALDLARLTNDTVLPRLIEAVLLHAGRELAKGMDRSMFT